MYVIFCISVSVQSQITYPSCPLLLQLYWLSRRGVKTHIPEDLAVYVKSLLRLFWRISIWRLAYCPGFWRISQDFGIFIAKVSLVGGALAWGLDPRCSGRRLFLYRGFKFVLLFWSTVIAQRFGFANMKSNAHLNLQYKTRSKPPS